MAAPKTKGTHADQFKKLEKRQPRDIDPENDAVAYNSADESDDDDSVGNAAGREHYESVGTSKLRSRDQEPLGPQYKGANVSRKGLSNGDTGHDPFEDFDDDEISASEGSELAGSEDVDEMEDMRDSEDDEDGDEDKASDSSEEQNEREDRENLRRLMNDEQKAVAASIAEATLADADKGRAVKRQRETFDAFLNGRIRLQPGLTSVNSFAVSSGASDEAETEAFCGAEQAALKLWNNLESFQERLHEQRTGTKRKRLEASEDTSNSEVWSHMQGAEQSTLPYRRSVLQKWSNKTQAATTQPISSRLNNSARPTTILDVLADQLSNSTRLINRTRMPRSCAPIQAARRIASDESIYDDADFYGVLLKELLEQRNVDAASNVQLDQAAQQWRAAREAKTKKNVDTKASKGRKMRYTVHEKLQNFVAPEDRGTWGQRQIDELFGSLLGRRLALREDIDEQDDGEMENGDAEGEALRLFRS